ncbi:MAG: hypothetical protein WC713_04305 [Candidatus Methylomirabilota bacterium]
MCWLCGGEGTIVTCCDDMCRGLGECIHGDGEAECPECHGGRDCECCDGHREGCDGCSGGREDDAEERIDRMIRDTDPMRIVTVTATAFVPLILRNATVFYSGATYIRLTRGQAKRGQHLSRRREKRLAALRRQGKRRY